MLDATVAKRRARKAKNQARWRRNADRGAQVCPVLITRDLLDWLIDDIAWVPEALAGNRHEIGKAITEGLAEAAPSPLRRTQSRADIAMPRIVQYASDCTAPLFQALGKFRHSVMIPID